VLQNDALVFTSPLGAPLRNSNFRQRFWVPALSKAGLTGTHFHDLRHTGNVLAAGTGATLRGLMDRMGHSNTRAAMIYMHGADLLGLSSSVDSWPQPLQQSEHRPAIVVIGSDAVRRT